MWSFTRKFKKMERLFLEMEPTGCRLRTPFALDVIYPNGGPPLSGQHSLPIRNEVKAEALIVVRGLSTGDDGKPQNVKLK
jgi:hypothetical protein